MDKRGIGIPSFADRKAWQLHGKEVKLSTARVTFKYTAFGVAV